MTDEGTMSEAETMKHVEKHERDKERRADADHDIKN